MADGVVTNATGIPIDPVDGDPVFTYVDGVPYSLTRWRQTAYERKQAVADDLAELASKHRTKRSK